jgi:hypothetical protein
MTFLDLLEAAIRKRLRAKFLGGISSPKGVGGRSEVVSSGRRELLRTGAALPRPRLHAIGRSSLQLGRNGSGGVNRIENLRLAK